MKTLRNPRRAGALTTALCAAALTLLLAPTGARAQAVTVTAPPSFTVLEDVAGNLTYTGTPFSGAGTAVLTVTLTILDGTLTGNAGTGITVAGTATARTFSGTTAALNTYFTTAGKLNYTTARDNNAPRTLTTTVSAGGSGTATSAVNITPVNDPPTFTLASNVVSVAANSAFHSIPTSSRT